MRPRLHPCRHLLSLRFQRLSLQEPQLSGSYSSLNARDAAHYSIAPQPLALSREKCSCANSASEPPRANRSNHAGRPDSRSCTPQNIPIAAQTLNRLVAPELAAVFPPETAVRSIHSEPKPVQCPSLLTCPKSTQIPRSRRPKPKRLRQKFYPVVYSLQLHLLVQHSKYLILRTS